MSTTTVTDLLDRAHLLARDLRRGDSPTTRNQWDAFDDTVHRLTTSLLGPGGRNIPVRSEQRIQLLTAAKTYPTPLRDHASLTAGSPRTVRPLSYRPGPYAPRNAHLRLVTQDAVAVPTLPDLDLPTATDPHPMARLTCTLGALADLLHGRSPLDPVSPRSDVADATSRVLAVAAVAARHTLTQWRIHDAASLEDAAHILEVAVWAERSIDRLGPRPVHAAVLDLVSATTADRGSLALNDRLEAARADWEAAARAEVGALIPSVDVLRVIANQAAHLYGVTAQLLEQDPALDTASSTVVSRLAWAAEAFQAADREWAGITTLARPGHEFLSQSRNLLSVLTEVARHDPNVTLDGLDGSRALRDLVDLAATITELASATRDLPSQLARSHLIFGIPDKLTDPTQRLTMRPSKRAIPLSIQDTPVLQARWGEACVTAASAARDLVGMHLGRAPVAHDRVERTLH